MYRYHDKNGEYISLHDCKAEKIKFKNGVLSFYFNDGFWLYPNHFYNPTEKTLKTDAAKVKFHLAFEDKNDFSFYILSRINKKNYRKRLCTEPKIKKFIKKINAGKCSLEFLYMYATKGNDLKIIECVLWDKKKPKSEKCIIKLDSDRAEYCRNTLTETEW